MSDLNHVIYLSYTGMLEPLGRSQVLNYLSRLTGEYSFTLVSFEKSQDMMDEQAVSDMVTECEKLGIAWKPQIYHHRPRIPATVWDLLVLLCLTLKHSSRRDVCLVHCRGYIPAIAAWLCSKVTRKPFIFDMRALWPDEMVTAGRLREGSLVYRALKWIERRLLCNSSVVVSLTEAAVDHLVEVYPEIPRDKFDVITTCVDISRFNISEKHSPGHNVGNRQPFVVGTMGTLLSGWFYLDDFFTFFKVLKKHRADAIMSIVTRDDHSKVLERSQAQGINPSDIRIATASPSEMPQYLGEMDVGVMFYAPDIGRAPTRLAEFLSTGIPVVGNRGVGDLGRLIDSYEVGAVVDDCRNPVMMDKAVCKLFDLYDDIIDSQRCRAAAQEYFTVEKGAECYRVIYHQIS